MIGQPDRNTEEAKPGGTAVAPAKAAVSGGAGVKKKGGVSAAAKATQAAVQKAAPWRVPVLSENWNLNDANMIALDRAKAYMNGILNRDDMRLEIQPKEEDGTAAGEEKSAELLDGFVGQVLENNTGRTVSAYKGYEVLKFYAHSTQEMGIMVDGTV